MVDFLIDPSNYGVIREFRILVLSSFYTFPICGSQFRRYVVALAFPTIKFVRSKYFYMVWFSVSPFYDEIEICKIFVHLFFLKTFFQVICHVRRQGLNSWHQPRLGMCFVCCELCNFINLVCSPCCPSECLYTLCFESDRFFIVQIMKLNFF